MAAASAGFAPGFYSPLGLGYYSGYAPAPLTYAAAPISSQYHAQDELGQYSYGYAGGQSAKAESKSFDGVTRGSYSYVDANGVVQQVAYTADAVNGFRVAATNLPVAPAAAPAPIAVAGPAPVQDTPEVSAAKAEHARAHAEAAARAAAASPAVVIAPAPVVYAAPVPVQDTPEVAAAKAEHARAHADALARASL